MRRSLGLIAGLVGLTAAHAVEPPSRYVVAISETHPFSPSTITFLMEAYKRIGITIEVKPFPPGRSVELANRGDVDAEAVRVPDAMGDRDNLIAVPEPLGRREAYAFTTGAVLTIDGWESLRPYRLCVMVGDLIAMKRTDGMDRETARDDASEFRMLKSGRCEVAVSDGAAWLTIDQAHLGPIRMIETPIQSFSTYHYVNRRHADLVPALTKAFQDMNEEGFTQKLLKHYVQEIAEARARNSVEP